MEKSSKFLEKNVRCILEPLVQNICTDKPKDPVKYMIMWLNDYMGVKDGKKEVEELKFLRKEVEKYREKQK